MPNKAFLHYRRESESQRYYEVIISRDFFGWCLTRSWGRINTSMGKAIHMPCNSFEEGEQKLKNIHKRRLQRGYSMVKQEPIFDQ